MKHQPVRRVVIPAVAQHVCLLCAALSLFAACSRTPARVNPPDLDASQAAAAAMTQYDKDGNGQIDGAELEAAPSLKAALGNLDQDGNGSVSEVEIQQRVEAWLASRLGISTVTCLVQLDGQPVSGATVTFEPDGFLKDTVKVASGTTDDSGMAAVSIPTADLPNPNMSGAQVGLYLVRISKQEGGEEKIPTQFNSATTLGAEVALDSDGLREGFTFSLSSK